MTSTYFPAFPQGFSTHTSRFTLRNEITALRLCGPPKTKHNSAIFVELPKGAVLTACGSGFNHRTIRVRWQNDTYYVFERDLVEDDPFAD